MMRTGGLPGTYPDDRRAAAMPIATAAPPSWPVYRRHGPTPPAEAGSTKGATGRRQLPQSRNGGYRARRPPPCSCLGSPHTHHAAAVAAYRRARGKTTELRPEWKAQWISNGFSMDFQWIFNGSFFSIFFFIRTFIITLESSRSQWIFFLMGPLMDLVMDRGGPMDFKWIFNGTFNGCFFSIV